MHGHISRECMRPRANNTAQRNLFYQNGPQIDNNTNQTNTQFTQSNSQIQNNKPISHVRQMRINNANNIQSFMNNMSDKENSQNPFLGQGELDSQPIRRSGFTNEYVDPAINSTFNRDRPIENALVYTLDCVKNNIPCNYNL